jgi:hypothetical protein
MKKLLSILLISLFATPTFAHTTDIYKPATKQICKVVKRKQHCRTIKIHKSYKGTKVPTRKKK